MPDSRTQTLDGNEAAALIAHRVSEVCAIYPITPSSPMGELADEWSAAGRTNIFGNVPQVIEMQSEGGAAGAVHGAVQAGALATTFTASQGLLLMIPNMYKIAGELSPFVMHVTARTIATHALSIFGDHSDVMACRQTGFAMLCSSSVQEAHDMAMIAHAATLRTRLPFLHFFDGFRTSHEVAKIELIEDEVIRDMIDMDAVRAHRQRALTPDKPVIRGTAQNPDSFFQAREACNAFYDAAPAAIQETMDRFAALTGRKYRLADYHGHPQAERVIILMGSGCTTAEETVDWMISKGEKVGVLKLRLYRPFPAKQILAALPATTRVIAVLDRTKEPGAPAEPLCLDVVCAVRDALAAGEMPLQSDPLIVGGRYGLSSKEFTPAMVKGVFDELARPRPRSRFTVGILDDVSRLSLPWDHDLDIEPDDVFRAVFFGLGADGTVGANKNTIKIIGEETDQYAQGYFVYDSKKSGAITISHVRFGPRPIPSAYLIKQAHFVGCHQFNFLEKYDVVGYARPGGILLINSPFGPDEVWDHLPRQVQQDILAKRLRIYVIDAYKVARETGMGVRINTIMQTCFFGISGVLPRDEAIAKIKKAVEKTYGRKGPEVVRKNFEAIDHTLSHLFEAKIPGKVTSTRDLEPIVPDEAPDFVKRVSALMLANKGDLLPVSAFPVDGTWPLSTTRWEKRNIAHDIPVWDPSICIQCNKCAMVCPHAAIRAAVYPAEKLAGAPPTFKSVDYKAADFKGFKYTIQVAPEDCTGCNLCVVACPAKNKSQPKLKALNMAEQAPLRAAERENYRFFLGLPEPDRTKVRIDVKGSQFFQPLFEYSGACSGCGETPYVKLLTQLFGDRAVIANATGCSSIYGGNLPTTPYCTNADGRGPAWANSLFEDNAEFGLGIRLGIDAATNYARVLLKQVASRVGDELVREILEADQSGETGIALQRQRVAALRRKIASFNGSRDETCRRLDQLADYLVHKSVWVVGGDGWAYDIGYGGLDHVISLPVNINILVLDTEVYSNTGGQCSKSTPIGASAKFAMAGKSVAKKNLGLMAMQYGTAYVARVAFGAKDVQTVKAFIEAESYNGPSLILAYSHCIAHGYDLSMGLDQQRLAVESGYWPLYRYDPRRRQSGENPLQLDSVAPRGGLEQFVRNEARFRMIQQANPRRFDELLELNRESIRQRFEQLEHLAKPFAAAATAAATPAPAKENS